LLGEHLEDQVQEADIRSVKVRSIIPNPYQPRREFKPEDLAELEASIRENGLLQPLVVRPSPGSSGRFELVAGERRFRCVKRLGWEEVSAVVRDVEDKTLLVLALVENIQRSALNPLEEAEGYRALADEFDLSQEQIAQAVGKSRPAVANMLRLLRLPPSVRKLLGEGSLSTGHARALLALESDVRAGELARKAVADGWSVREMERRVRSEAAKASDTTTSGAAGSGPRDPVVLALEDALRHALGSRVSVRERKKGGGSVEIPFADAEEFERLFKLLTGEAPSSVLD
jgi:ParB family chromosome partitioning protein